MTRREDRGEKRLWDLGSDVGLVWYGCSPTKDFGFLSLVVHRDQIRHFYPSPTVMEGLETDLGGSLPGWVVLFGFPKGVDN